VVFGLKIPVPGLLYPGVFLIAWFFGFGAGCLATVTSTLLASYLFYEPRFSFVFRERDDLLRLAIFASSSIFAAWIVARGRAAELGLLLSQRERDSLLVKANEAVRVRDEFLSISSHELRTPLTPLRLQIQSLSRYLDRGALHEMSDEKLRRMLEVSEKQVNRLTALIDDLLDVSRITSGKLTLNLEAVDLVEVTREVLDRYQPQLVAAGSELQLNLPATLPARVDRLRFEQIVVNFLTNAVRYAGGKPIQVSLREEAGKALLRVQDSGIGISKEDQKRIFDRFERVLSSTNYGGLGLGLFIVRQIVLAHGGSVEVESESGKGAAFLVWLPLPKVRD